MKINKIGFVVSVILSLFIGYIAPIYGLAFMLAGVQGVGQQVVLSMAEIVRLWLLVGIVFFAWTLYITLPKQSHLLHLARPIQQPMIPHYAEKTLPILAEKNRWLWNVLANELYEDHPELWSWIKAKLDEYERRFKGKEG